MAKGPCLCGDPYCGSCGDPGAVELEAASEGVMDAFGEAKFTVEEYALAGAVAIAAVEAHRKAAKVLLDEQRADHQQYIDHIRREGVPDA